MNQQIRELAEQSYKEVIETNDYNGDAYTVREFDQEKFAKLIVAECARIARNTDLEDVEGGDSAVLQAAGEQIEKHFGVE